MNAPRKWWIAGLMSLIQLGLGQVYNGQLKKGIFVLIFKYCYVALLVYILFQGVSMLSVLVLVALAVLFYIFVVADSILVAKHNVNYELKRYNTIYAYLAILVILWSANYIFSYSVKNNFAEAFKVASAGMEPTLLKDEHIMVDRSSSARLPHRGDIIVFESPEDVNKTWLKRVVAIGGDKVEMRDAVLYINGNAVSEPYLKQSDVKNYSWSNFGEVIVPNRSYYVLGDNRNNSKDSRSFGAIEQNKVKGIVRNIYWSWDKEAGTIRWGRIGITVH